MPKPSAITQGEVRSLEGLIAWFHKSSLKLAEEYQRLEERVALLNRELEKKNQELEKSLREREEARGYLLSVLESLKAGVLVLDRELRPTLVNRRLCELLGEVGSERVLGLLGKKLAGCLKRGESHFLPVECERVVPKPDGSALPVHLTVSEVLVGGRQGAGYVLVLHDLSRVKRLEAEAARSHRLAALGQMAASIAHEVRSPLGGIELCASLLKEREEGQGSSLAAEILKAVHRLRSTTSRLLAFAAEPTLASEPLSVAWLLQEVGEMALPLLQKGRWTLEISIEEGLPLLWGDRRLLAQALLNLVANAAEAMPSGGRIQIQAQRLPFASRNGRIQGEVAIRVRDEGVGIAPEDQEKIFDPFFTTKPGGTGLGLALTHKIVGAHRGFLEVSSEPGQGSCFTLSLPAADGTTSLEKGEEHAEADCYCGG